jgi:hypothetical protein
LTVERKKRFIQVNPMTTKNGWSALTVAISVLGADTALAQAPVVNPPAAVAAVPVAPPTTAQRIDPMIAPVKRATPAKTKIDPTLAASLKAKGAQLAGAVKAMPKKDAIAAAKTALASAKLALAKAVAAKKAPAQPAGKSADKALVKTPVKTAIAPAVKPVAPTAAKPL